MAYFLYKRVVADAPTVEITSAEYHSIRSAWHALTAIVEIEESWDCLIQNYIELETELLSAAMSSVVQAHESWEQFQDLRLLFARRLSNLLQSCRSYLDHTPHFLKEIPCGNFAEQFKQLTHQFYDCYFGYRFMEALRNYSQHRGLPLHGTTFDATWVDINLETARNRHTVTANVDLEKLRADKKFSSKIWREINQDKKKYDVIALTREYIEGLGAVQTGLRKAIEKDSSQWKTIVRSAIARYAAVNHDNVTALNIGKFEDSSEPEQTPILNEMLVRIDRLNRKNSSLVNLHRRFASNEILF